jgi:hypothetical protein
LFSGAPGSPEGMAEAQLITANLEVVQLHLQTLQKDLGAGASKTTIRQDVRAHDQSLAELARDEARLTADTFDDLGSGHDHAHGAATRGFDLTTQDNVFAGLGKQM